jgi:YVTN family beta-propeller protein
LAQAPATGPYSVIQKVKVGGEGGTDYIYADVAGRRLYISRKASRAIAATDTTPAIDAMPSRITVFNLDTLEPLGSIPDTGSNGVAVDAKSGHGFSSSKPVAMWDAKTLTLIKTIDVDGAPDGILNDPFNQRVYIMSHRAPTVTVIDAKNGEKLGTIDVGGAPLAGEGQ